MGKFSVYRITNRKTGMVYIGFTSQSVAARWATHKWQAFRKNAKSKFHKAIREYGEDSFVVEIVYESQDKNETLQAEARIINEHDSILNGYNMREGGQPIRNVEKKLDIEPMVTDKTRPFCECGNPAAVNYINRDTGKRHYRSKCELCLHGSLHKPKWDRAGYKKKDQCDKCKFKAKYSEQLSVYFIDGNMSNIHSSNLRTVCANCRAELQVEGWTIGDLHAD